MNAALELPAVDGELQREEPMSRHTSWRVGGPAEIYFRPASVDDISRFLAALPGEVPIFWVGLGSNLLVRDGGIRGAVIATHRVLNDITSTGEGRLRAEAGVPCARLARHCVRAGLGGAEFFAGIPGTLGGALAMNAGAWGGETWDHVQAVEVMDRGGQMHRREPGEYEIGYRTVRGPGNEWYLAAELAFESDPSASMDRIAELLTRRRDTQPIGKPSCGSVFRNPEGDHAARLIEAAGLKGHQIGGARVSEKHANFIVNAGDALAADIEALIEHVRATVSSVHGVELHPEVRIVGAAA